MIKRYEAEPAAAEPCALGEGPVWDGAGRSLVWVDIEGRTLLRYRPAEGAVTRTVLPQKIGAAVPAEDGSWVVALADGFYRLHPATGETVPIAATAEPNPANRLNDGKCDRNGRFWCGTMSANWQKDGSLYVLEAGGKLTRKLTGVICSNGLAWNADNNLMYYIDTGDRAVYAFDYEAETGTIANRRVLLDFVGEEGNPDGMTIDAEGMLWIAHWGGWQVSRWDPATGRKLATVRVPVKNVTSCTFGGDGLDELYITTARIGNEEPELAKQPLAGALFRARVDAAGLPVEPARI